MNDFAAKLEAFRDRLEKEMNAETERRHGRKPGEDYPGLNGSAIKNGRRGYHHIGIDKPGPRFIRIYDESGTDIPKPPHKLQKSVRYFVERETGVIFGASGWKAYNPVHQYGTLETLDEYEWGDYYGKRKDGASTIVPKAARR